MFKRIAEPGRLIISLALLAISLLLILVDQVPIGVLFAAAVAGAWGIRIVNHTRSGGPPSPS